MSLDEDDVLQILDLFAESDWDDLRLESGDVRLTLSKRAGAGLAADGTGTAPAPPRAAVTPAAQAMPPPPAPDPPADDEPPPGVVAVRSPTLGTFFVAPKPGAAPFVRVGSVVAPGDTVGIVEVMKLFSPVKVGVAGEITKVCARNNELVEHDRPLFWVKPA